MTAPLPDPVRMACRELGIEARGAVVALASVKLWGPAGELSWWWVASPALSLLVLCPAVVRLHRWLAGRRLRRMQLELEQRAAAARAKLAGNCSSGCSSASPSACSAHADGSPPGAAPPAPRASAPKLSEAARRRVERMARRRSSRDTRNDEGKDSTQ